jgi:response regulator of citrate/malate metabolism
VCHVLIIEDEPFIAMILQDLLEEVSVVRTFGTTRGVD